MSGFFSKSKKDMHYLLKPSSQLNAKGRRRKHRAALTLFGLFLVLVQLVAMVLFLFRLIHLDVLPVKYMAMIGVILSLLLLYDFTSQFTRAHVLGKILSVILSVVLLFGFLLGSRINDTLNSITSVRAQTDNIDIIVLADDSADSIDDALSYTFGYNALVSSSVVSKALEDIETNNSAELSKKTYTSWENLLEALYKNSEIQAIAITDVMRSSLIEQGNDLDKRTKVIGTIKITSHIKVNTSNKKSHQEPFIVYISGNDGYGSISDVGRSDVNILAVINPQTRQVLLVSTPRDYYITISDAAGNSAPDKLTHAGNAGTHGSIEALETLYGITVDYYFKINFSGCVEIVDALGGITIYSDVAFTNGWKAAPDSYDFVIGPNDCNGAKTLAFVREREAFASGDHQRGKNQAAAIKAMISKATSPAILTNYSAVLEAVSGMMLTDMSTDTITSLVKDQIADPTSWTVQSYSVTGTGAYRNSTLYQLTGMQVVLPDYDTVNLAIQMINSVYNGEIIDVEAITSDMEN